MTSKEIITEVRNQAEDAMANYGQEPSFVYMDELLVKQLSEEFTTQGMFVNIGGAKNTIMGIELIEVKKKGHINVV